MAKIFISYSHEDKPFAATIASELSKNDQIVYFDLDLKAGDNWRAQLSNRLSEADVFIIILSNASASASYPMAEVGRALGRAENEDILILPISIDDVKIPTILQDRLVFHIAEKKIEEYIPEIISAIVAFEGRRKEKQKRIKEVEADLSTFVDEAIKQQQFYEKNNKRWSRFWQSFAVSSLSLIGFIAWDSIERAVSQNVVQSEANINIISIASIAAGSLVIIGVLTGLARYAYSLSTSYMSESLKSADRIHAIQFGKFFLKAYGGKLTPAEVKDAFQHWNIDRSSTFSNLDSAQIDPQIYALISQIVGVISSKK